MADWSRRFDEPIPLTTGGELRTLLDAGRYIEALPESQHERAECPSVTLQVLALEAMLIDCDDD
jgi:hypothetical protein